jgi:tetratricopeptide (TPR) repeat protein
MSSKRPVVLMGILLLLILGVAAWFGPLTQGASAAPPVAKALPGVNSISKFVVHQEPDTRWMGTLEYFYTGSPELTTFKVDQWVSRQGDPVAVPVLVRRLAARSGSQRVQFEIYRPHEEPQNTTREFTVVLSAGNQTLATYKLAQTIVWPTFAAMARNREFATNTPQQILDRAVSLIDTNQRHPIAEAKELLLRLLEKNPRMDAAYIEMARVAMKQNWGPEGLYAAEKFLGSAMEIQPDNVNSKILLAYVYAHQKRFKDSEVLMVEAAKSEPPNIWLWTNWGDLYRLQGKQDAAIAKYREAIARPPSKNTYDRARRFAFDQLFPMLEARKDVAGAEALHKQRTADYGGANCFGIEYARFVLDKRGDAAAAIDLARATGEGQCDAQQVRDVRGIAHYVAWSQAQETARADLLREARLYAPTGAALFYRLASSDKTTDTLRQLLGTGERIDQLDNNRATALTYALQNRELDTARRLLKLGARTDVLVGDEMPVALLPVMAQDVEGIRLMQKSGVDYSKVRYRGTTALDHARAHQDKKLMDVLDPKSGAL